VVDPIGIDRLLPGWREDPSLQDRNDGGSIPVPRTRRVSPGNVCRWLATKAEELGVETLSALAETEAPAALRRRLAAGAAN